LEPLSITCDTCSARLKVRDPAAIGQILSCPKCQSMVLVEAPEGWTSPTESTAEVADDSKVAAPPVAADKSPVAAVNPSSMFDDNALLDETPASVSAPAPESELAEPLPDLTMPESASPWNKVMASKAGRWSVIGGGAVTAVLIGVVGWSILGGDSADTDTDIAAQQESGDDTASKTSPESKPKSSEATAPKPKIEPPAENNPFATQPKPEPTTNQEPKVLPPGSENPFDNGPTDPDTKKPDPLEPIVREPAEPNEPEKTDPSIPKDQPDANASSKDLLSGLDLLDEGNLFGIDSGFTLPTEPAAAEPKVELPAPAKVPGDGEPGAGGRTELAKIDLDAALKFEMLGAKYERIRMIDFLETMSDLSRVPITMDLDALEPLKISPASRINVIAGKTTIGSLIDGALKTHHKKLGVVRNDQGLTIAPLGFDRPLPMDHPIDDLAATPAERAALVETIQKFVQPDSWTEVSGKSRIADSGDALHIEHDMQAQYQVIVLLEKLRTARSKPSNNTYFDAQTFHLKSRRERAAKKTSRTLDLNHVIQEPLATIVRKLEWAAGTNIAVDWSALRSESIGRDTPARLIARSKTLAEAMDALVQPLGLAWRVHDATTLQISTKQQINDRLELEIYDLKNVLAAGLAGEKLLEQIRRDTDPKLWQTDSGSGRLQIDPSKSCLLVLANQSTQIAVTQLLTRLRKQNLARRSD
jgi:hypothetical protein